MVFTHDGTLMGVEVDLAVELGHDLDRPVLFAQLAWEQLIPALTQGRIDVIMSGMSITTYRKQHIRFTDPYMQIGQMAVIRVEDVGRLGRPEALYGTTGGVGFKRRTTGELFARASLKSATLRSFPEVDDGLLALRAGEIDFFVHDAPTVWRITADPSEHELIGLHWPLTQEHLAWGTRNADTAFRQRLNALIAEWKRSGRLQTILNRWITLRVQVEQEQASP
jgi:ABC-type amino acid transport substrate-binding protein